MISSGFVIRKQTSHFNETYSPLKLLFASASGVNAGSGKQTVLSIRAGMEADSPQAAAPVKPAAAERQGSYRRRLAEQRCRRGL
jgi:hypothetical protein